MSREIDALIAEHVFDFGQLGLKVCRTVDELRAAIRREPQPHESCFLPLLADQIGQSVISEYSKSLGSAWTVVGEMRKRGWIELHLTQYTDGSIRAAFIGDDKPTVIAYGERDAEAICLAALKALGISPETSKEG